MRTPMATRSRSRRRCRLCRGGHINDNVFVHAGDLLLKIDPRDYVAARDQAQANLDAALAERRRGGPAHTQVRAPRTCQARAQLSRRANLAQAKRSRRQHDVDPAPRLRPMSTATTAVRSNAANVQVGEARFRRSPGKDTIERHRRH